MDIKRIIALIEGKDFMQLKAVLLEEQVQDIAELIDELSRNRLCWLSACCPRMWRWTCFRI